MEQRLLIADRDTELCEVFRRLLTERGYEVETSTDGLDCLAKLRQWTPAVLVLDLELPWAGGDGVLALLRAESPAPRIPVLLTATAAAPAHMAEVNEPPVVGYLPKPLALTALLESVRSAVARRGRREASNLNRVPRYSASFFGLQGATRLVPSDNHKASSVIRRTSRGGKNDDSGDIKTCWRSAL